MDQLPNSKDFFYQTNSRGLIEMVDAVTGKIIKIQHDYNEDIIPDKVNNLIEYQLPNGQLVLGTKGLNLEDFHTSEKYKYNRVIVDIICNKIMEGGLITQICKEPGMPSYSLITRWRVQHKEFGEMLEMARKARAEAQHDKVLECVEEDKLVSMTKDELAAYKLRVDTLKWAAEKNDPARFGRDKAANSQPGALQIIVNTGINRDDDVLIDQNVIDAVGKEIPNEQD